MKVVVLDWTFFILRCGFTQALYMFIVVSATISRSALLTLALTIKKKLLVEALIQNKKERYGGQILQRNLTRI